MSKSKKTENTIAKRKRTNNDLQSTTQKAKHRATRTRVLRKVKPFLHGGLHPTWHPSCYSCYNPVISQEL